MFRIILPLLAVLAVAGFLMYRFVIVPKGSINPRDVLITGSENMATSSANKDIGSRLSLLEKSVVFLNDKVSGQSENTIEAKLNNLESQIGDLNGRINTLEGKPTTSASPTPSPQSTAKQPTIYIPFGGSASEGDRNWFSVEAFEISLDPNNFPGYTGVRLEVNAKLSEPVGTGNFRLYNQTDGSAVSGSDVSTTANKFTLLTSSSFKLPSGTKTYKFQIKSTEGYQAIVNQARLKVEF